MFWVVLYKAIECFVKLSYVIDNHAGKLLEDGSYQIDVPVEVFTFLTEKKLCKKFVKIITLCITQMYRLAFENQFLS